MLFSDIPGWFDFEDLYDWAVGRAVGRTNATKDPPPVLVEVGCWLGKSTAYMAGLVKRYWVEGGPYCQLRFFAVDNFKGSANDGLDKTVRQMESEGKSLYARWLDNMTACGVSGFVQPLIADSVGAARVFVDSSVEFVFIDADHRYEFVRADIEAWLPKVRPGGVLAGHDYNRDEVSQAVRDVLGYYPQPFNRADRKPENGNLTCWYHVVGGDKSEVAPT